MEPIEKHSGVCGGEACIASTRIPVWLLEQMRALGATETDILYNYPTLKSQQLAHAWDYVRAHPEEIEQAIRANEQDEDDDALN